MNPDDLQVGQAYPGKLFSEDGAQFEFSKEGPELRLFFARITDAAAREVENAECRLGLLRAGDVTVVPWQIGDSMMGDAQFHVFLYPPETRPTDMVLAADQRLMVRIILVDRADGRVRAVRRVMLSPAFSQALAGAISHQLGNHIGREEYDAQVGIYQSKYPDVREAIQAADIFEKVEG